MPKKKSKPYFFLDLDATIICSVQKDELDIEDEKNKEKITRYTYHVMDKEYTDSTYVVFERPNLQKFLDYLFENYNVSVWTAATGDYASFIAEKVIVQNKPERKLKFFLWRDHCDMSINEFDETKRLKMFWTDNKFKTKGMKDTNTFILDDNPDVWKQQNNTCIHALIFNVLDDDSHNDDFLIKVMDQLEKNKMDTYPTLTINSNLNVKNEE